MKRQDRKTELRRCAIYTRVSTEYGLEQEFNSLDNQREASEAYIKSQAHEGWKLIRDRYDDGGFSGGSMDRPALKKLLDDVRARRIDVIVVYKVDRLTRSLADFAKLVELFDEHEVSFISVTQSFNTTTSMGRLTLNMLLSFAQFEREITGERIRDKVAASKKKGIWMGGAVPIGYRAENRALHIVEEQADFVRDLFRRYLEVGSAVRLKSVLDAQDVRLPIRTVGTGRATGGGLISQGHIYHILSNPIYAGRLRHKEQIHDGQHAAIVDDDVWGRVQVLLANQTQTRKPASQDVHSFLAGKLFDDRGHRMGPSHAAKGGRRWRYYISRAVLKGRKQDAGSVARVPAAEIEKQVLQAIKRLLPAVEHALDGSGGSVGHFISTPSNSALAANIPSSTDPSSFEDRARSTIGRVTIGERGIELEAVKRRLPAVEHTMDGSSGSVGHSISNSSNNMQAANSPSSAVQSSFDDRARGAIERVTIGKTGIEIELSDATVVEGARIVTIPWTLPSPHRRREIFQGEDGPSSTIRPMRVRDRAVFAEALGDAHRWLDELTRHPDWTTTAIAIREGKTERSIRMTLSLAFVAPPIVAAAIEGRLPRGFGVKRLMDLPMLWSHQWTALGLAPPA
jgi:DNA invertase Pin-like site-specific DNA recombinase